MALEPKVSHDSVNKATTELYVVDVTGNYGDIYYEKDESGNFQQLTNTTGYGAETVPRAQLANLFVAKYNGSKTSELIEPKPYNPTDPLLTKVTFPYAKDGWYRYYILSVPIYDAALVYGEGDFTFHADADKSPYGGTVKRFLLGEWVETTTAELINTLYSDLPYKGFTDKLNRAKTSKYLGKLNNEKTKKFLDDPMCHSNKDFLIDREEDIERLYNQAQSAFCNGYKPTAQRMVEAVQIIIGK
jgi:hypothetical protein